MRITVKLLILSMTSLVPIVANADYWVEKSFDSGHLVNHTDSDATYANLTNSAVSYTRAAGSHTINNEVTGATVSPTAPDSWWGFLKNLGVTTAGTVTWSSAVKSIPALKIYTFGHTYTMREGVTNTWTKYVLIPYSSTDYTRTGSGLVGNIEEYETFTDAAPGTGGGG